MALLKTPIEINGLTIPNRLVMPPMATAKATAEGAVTDELVAYYDEKSAGGYLGLVIVEHAFVSADGMARPNQVSIAKDGDIEGLTRIVEVVHKNGSRIVAQINHGGAACQSEATGHPVISASPVPMETRRGPGETPREMTKEDIARVTADFAAAAARARAAGFDGVEIHSAHGYLLNQFYSPIMNHRTDEYGGPVENRIRFHLEVIRAVRAAVGPDFLVALRLGASDYREGGSTVMDALTAARLFEAAGLDLLDISGGFCGFTHPTSTVPGYFKDASLPIKQAVSIPVILAGGITKGRQAEELLTEGAADMIGVARPVLADSLWAKHAMESLNDD